MFEIFKDKIITIEGQDGSGKDLITTLLSTKIPNSKVVRFPNYEINTGKRIKNILTRDTRFPGNYEFQSLQLANKIESILDLNFNNPPDVFIFCRYWESSLIYGLSDGLPADFLLKINSVLPKSKQVFILSGKRYGNKNSDYYETDCKQKRISELYLHFAKKLNWQVINNDRIPDEIVNDILSKIKE